MKRTLLIATIAIVFFLLAALVIYRRTLAQISLTEQSSGERLGQNTVIAQLFAQHKPFTILLLGIAGGDHEGAYLSDAIIAARINPQKNTINLISLPRDLLVVADPMLNVGHAWKMNAFYAIGMNDKDFPSKSKEFQAPVGGGNLTKRMVNDVTGLDPIRFVVIEFAGFQSVIDAMGGIDVVVKKGFTDKEYPRDGHENDLCAKANSDLPELLVRLQTEAPYEVFPCRYRTITFAQGMIHLNGADALAYARSRHSSEDGSDFARSDRQKQIVSAIRTKLLSAQSIPKLPQLLDVVTKHIRTDLTTAETHSLILHAPELNKYDMSTLTPSNADVLVDSSHPTFGYTLVPRPGVELDKWIQQQLQ